MSKEDEGQASLLIPPAFQRSDKFTSFQDLAKVRIIQKTVVYVIGLSSALANKEILCEEEYFGQYGQIVKIVVNKNGYSQNHQSEMTYSAYVSFATPQDASLALLAIDNTEVDGHVIRSSFGTTKYCSFFLRNMECVNKDCLYLHSLADEEDTLYKEDSYSNKMIFFQQQRIAIKIADIYNVAHRRKSRPGLASGFPSVDSIYHKEFLFDNSNYPNSNYNFNQSNIRNYRKQSAYDSSSNFSDRRFENDNENEDEVEYVLVKEPSKKRRKYKTNLTHSSVSSCKDESKKRKRNYTLEDFNKTPKQQDENTSSSSASTSNSNKNVLKLSTPRKQILFSSALKSRFDFVNDTNSDEGHCTEIPTFIQDLIYKKTSSFPFFRQFNQEIVNDQEILNEELKQISAWSDSSCHFD